MRRSLSFLIVVLLLLGVFTSVFAQETTEGFQYHIEASGNVTITGYLGKNSDMNIPSEIEGKPVTEIGNGAFMQNATFKRVIIPEGVVIIGNGAFSQCYNVVSIELPSTITVIGEAAFEGCFELRSINIPEGVKDIPSKALSGLFNMTEIVLPSTVRSIGYRALAGIGFKSVVLPEGLETIDEAALSGCSNLESLIIPNTVKKIGLVAFLGDEKLTSVILSTGLKEIQYGMFYDAKALEKVAIPKSVTRIGQKAFLNCYKVSVLGIKGSFAETYAKKNDIPFVTVDPVKDVTLQLNGEDVSKGKLSIDLGSTTTLQLIAQTSPENPWPGVTWKSSDVKVASVDASGLVTGLKKGKVTITATAVDGSGKKTTCEITVASLVKEINIAGDDTIQAGKKTELKATVLPETADSKKLDWTTSDKSIATVDARGVVTAKKVSEVKTVMITATAKDGSGIFASFVITVTP